jgi:predicted Rossmann-fold nucleotide-binding protein
MRRVPIVLVGKDYWGGLVDWIKKTVLGKEKNISKEDLDLYKLVDTPEEAMEYMLDKLDSSETNF